MAGNKKYYWLKLKDDFFRQKEIKKLRKVAGGDTYTVIYLKMLLLAIKNDNKLYFEGVEDDFAEELALELDEEVDNVKMTLAFLQNQRLIEMISEDEYLLPQCKTMTGVESTSAERVRKHRLKQKEDKKALHCNTDVTDSNKNVTTEKEKEKELDIEKEIELEIDIEKELDKEQQLCKSNKKVVVDILNLFAPIINEKQIELIYIILKEKQKDEFYLIEKLIIMENSYPKNKTAFLMEALKEDYDLNLETSVQNMRTVWEMEVHEKTGVEKEKALKRYEYFDQLLKTQKDM